MNALPSTPVCRTASGLVLAAVALLAGTAAAPAAAAPLVSWATSAGGGASNRHGLSVSALSDGSSIVTGFFIGTATFGGTTLVSAGNEDVFTARLNADGTWAWATRAGGAGGGGGSATDIAYGVVALPDGSSVVTGFFRGTATFGSTTLVAAGERDVFTAKVDADGTWAWATQAGGTGNDFGFGISALPDGSSIVAGYFTGTATFGGMTLMSTGGSIDVFAARMNADGTWAWATKAGGTGNDAAYGVSARADGSAIVAGYFDGTTTFGGSTLTSTGGADAFTARMNADGTWAWATRAGGSANDYANGVSALPDGSSIVTGRFRGTAAFGGTPLTSAGLDDVFIARVDKEGAWAWAAGGGGSASDSGQGISTRPDGTSIVTGFFSGTANFGSTTLTSAGNEDALTAMVDADGAWAWATRAGGPANNDNGRGVSALPDGSSIVAGFFTGTATFGGITLTGTSTQELFGARYLDIPSRPAAPRATAGDGSATVTITPLGGGSVTSYTATSSPAGRSCTIIPPTTTCTVGGLANGTSYTFTATATNDVGTSGESARSNAATPAAEQHAAQAGAADPDAARLRATVLPSRRRVTSGQQLRIGIRARNTGGSTARAVTSCMRLPATMVLVRAAGAVRSGRTVCFRQGAITAGSHRTAVVTVRAAAVRRVSQIVASTSRAAGMQRVSSAPVRVEVRPLPARGQVTG